MMKVRVACGLILVASLSIILVGCGGGGGSSLSSGLGTVRGTVLEFASSRAIRAAGDSITVSIDGTDLSTLAAADGNFVLVNVPPGLHTLVAQTQGRARAIVVSVEAGKETNVGEVVLQEAGQISGLVTSATTHQPIPGALVSVIEQVYTMDDQMPHPVRIEYTNDFGSYTIAGLPAGDYLVTISNDGYQPASLTLTVNSGATTPGDVALQPISPEETGSVEGTAYLKAENGDLTPISGVMVRLVSMAVVPMDVPPLPPTAIDESGTAVNLYPEPWPIPFPRDYYAFTGDDGKYRIDGVLPGDYMAVAIRPGLEIDSHPVTVTAKTVSQVDFTLVLFTPKFGVIEGTVTNSETKQPIAGAEVGAIWGPMPLGAESKGAIVMPIDDGTIMSCVTDEQGHYKLIVPAEVTAIYAWAEGFEWKEVAVTVVPDSTITADIQLTPYEQPPLPPPPGDGGGGTVPPGPPTGM